MSASDAVILLVADGLVAVGRVLGGLRARCAAEKHADALAEAEESRDSWEAGELMQCQDPPDWWSAMMMQSAECGECDHCTAPVRSAAVSTPAADNTTDTKRFKTYDSVDVDHLEAAYNYHKLAAGWSTDKRTMWFCEGCDWTGPTPQAHARHRFQILADMKNATHRIQEQLGGAS